MKFAQSPTDLEIAHYGVFTLTNFVTATVARWTPNRLTDQGQSTKPVVDINVDFFWLEDG